LLSRRYFLQVAEMRLRAKKKNCTRPPPVVSTSVLSTVLDLWNIFGASKVVKLIYSNVTFLFKARTIIPDHNYTLFKHILADSNPDQYSESAQMTIARSYAIGPLNSAKCSLTILHTSVADPIRFGLDPDQDLAKKGPYVDQQHCCTVHHVLLFLSWSKCTMLPAIGSYRKLVLPC
jgi:hypothetical protein